MGLKNFSMLEAVELAVGIEEEGERFYALAAERTDDPAARELFGELRKKEIEHRNTFRGLYSDMAAKQGDADADLYLLDPAIATVFHAYAETAVFPVKGAAKEIIDACEGMGDILRLGMQAEKDSILFYHEMLTHAPYPEAENLLREIIAEEGKHLAFLHDMLRKVSPGAAY